MEHIAVSSRWIALRPCHTRQFVLATCNAIFAEKNIAGCSWDVRRTQLVLRPAMRLYFTPAEYLKMSAAFWLCRIVIGLSSKNCETSCRGGVTRCNLSRSIAKSRSCFYFLCPFPHLRNQPPRKRLLRQSRSQSLRSFWLAPECEVSGWYRWSYARGLGTRLLVRRLPNMVN